MYLNSNHLQSNLSSTIYFVRIFSSSSQFSVSSENLAETHPISLRFLWSLESTFITYDSKKSESEFVPVMWNLTSTSSGELHNSTLICKEIQSDKTYHRISIRGEAWYDFVFSNHLQPGDELRFIVTNEPNEEAIVVFTVNCFRD